MWLAGEKYFVDGVSISLVVSSFKHTNQAAVAGSRVELRSCFCFSDAALLIGYKSLIITTFVFLRLQKSG